MVTEGKSETNKQRKKRNQLLVRFLNRQAHDESVIFVDLYLAPNKKKPKKLASCHVKTKYIKCGLLSYCLQLFDAICFVSTRISTLNIELIREYRRTLQTRPLDVFI